MNAVCLQSCKDDDDNLSYDCGCNSENLYEIPNDLSQIPESEQKTGLLFFNRVDEFGNGEYLNRFWIFQNSPCVSCKSHFIICEDQSRMEQFDFLKNTNDSILVSFQGGAKKTCFGPVALPANYSYKEIVLVEIQEQ